MKHQTLLFLTIGVIFFFILLNFKLQNEAGITGMAAGETYAVTLSDIVSKFFEVPEMQFHTGSCGGIARELYGNIAYKPIDVTSGYGTSEAERIATMNFGIERSIGTIDMIKGKTLMQGQEADSMISLRTETVIRIPPDNIRTTSYKMNLYGYSSGFFVITRGSFSTPTLECSFITQNSMAVCDCQAKPADS